MIKVKYVPYQPHCFAYGGFELQMLAALEATRKAGVDATRIDPWSRDADFQIMHCWGLGFHHYENMRWAKHAGKKVVLSALVSYYEGFNERFRHFLSTYIKKAQYLIYIANLADAVTVVNELQAEASHRYFKIPKRKIHVVPNIVHSNFFRLNSGNGLNEGIELQKPYCLTVGSVCTRKNQLNLIKAVKKSDCNLVIVGKLLDGEQNYGKMIEEEIEGNPKFLWIKGMESNSDELVSLYKNAAFIALPSFVEQQPITLLEAIAVGKPLLIADKAYSRQSYFRGALRVSPNSIDTISNGINQILKNPSGYTCDINQIASCTEQNVGNEYKAVYEGVCSHR